MNRNNILTVLVCPLCREEMRREAHRLVCPNNHSFDLAKSGYVNLLPPGKEKNARTGDEKAMIRARTDFLSRGHYDSISTHLGMRLADLIEDDGGVSFCDMGSGEGYHTVNIAKTLAKGGGRVLAVGADASKYGAEAASKLAKREGFLSADGVGVPVTGNCETVFVPANLFHLPVRDASFDACVSMFAPVAWEESARILEDGGILAVVSSGREHLTELRHLIYDEVSEADYTPAEEAGFTKIGGEELKYTATLGTNAEIRSLFTMTPFYYKTTAAGRERLYALDTLEVTVHVKYTFFRKV